ncbi:hypothetical protein [Streptomyces orinoci]|uniref:Uncharacterized protein n=1 Tax=Streptomyces orinoci TaxID=67339 RepID=A0ABV3K0F4_STRON|nr:hypothetical protein [Streptomyces orinoci]
MSVLTVLHTRIHTRREHRAATRRPGTLRGFAAKVVRRIADSPLDSTVLRAASAPAPATWGVPDEQAERPHAHWRMVTGPDGRRHLEAAWHLAH